MSDLIFDPSEKTLYMTETLRHGKADHTCRPITPVAIVRGNSTIGPSNSTEHLKGRVHTTLFRTGRGRSRPVRAQLPVSTRGKLERSFRILETTSQHGTRGRDRSRPVNSVVWTLEWALWSARQITCCYHTPH